MKDPEHSPSLFPTMQTFEPWAINNKDAFARL
jgi:hypothetical protein